jgi:hypothetical protein
MKLTELTVLTRDLDAALGAWKKASGLTGRVVETDDRRVGVLPVADVNIEVVQPQPGSRIERLIEERGEGMFSLTLEVDDFDSFVAYLRRHNVSVVLAEVGASNRREAMIDPISTHGVPMTLREKQE